MKKMPNKPINMNGNIKSNNRTIIQIWLGADRVTFEGLA